MSKQLVLKKPVIAITGSAGKTTTKEMIASVLRRRWRIVKTRQNRNFYTATKRYARELTRAHQAAVLEFGMLRAGHIRKHCLALQPNYGVVTNVGTAHIGNFGGKITGIARAKSELIRYMAPTGKLFLNADDVNSRLLQVKGFRGKRFTIGVRNRANYRAYNVRYARNGMAFKTKLGGREYTFFIPIHGEHNIYNALFAIAVCHQLRYHPSLIQLGLRTYLRPKRRLNTYLLRGNIRVIDDTFSANPEAMKAAIDVLASVGSGTRIAVLGSMLEMGDYAVKGHLVVGKYLAKKKVDYLYTYGKSARFIGRGAIKAGFPSTRVVHCMTKDQLHRKLLHRLKPNTSILIKASHKMRMNHTVGYLKTVMRSRKNSR